MTLLGAFTLIEAIARYAVGGAFIFAAVVAITHWAVRNGKLPPFGGWARAVRKGSDPVLRPIERRLMRAGANPQDGPFWLLGLTVLGGLALLALLRWALGFIYTFATIGQFGPKAAIATAVGTLFSLLMAALLVRVVASWFGISPYGRVMRFVHGLTDWLIEPIQRVVPNIGPLDLSPLLAYFILMMTRSLVMRAFF